jgi:hypothetical protein
MACISASCCLYVVSLMLALQALSLPPVARAEASAAPEQELRFVSLGDWGYVSCHAARQHCSTSCLLDRNPLPHSHAAAVLLLSCDPSREQVNDDQQAVAKQLARHAALINASFLLALGDNF